jgi:hypothetical protein
MPQNAVKRFYTINAIIFVKNYYVSFHLLKQQFNDNLYI